MSVEFAVVSAPWKKVAISEDAHRTIQREGVPFFAVVVDGHRSGHVSKSAAAQFSFYIAQLFGDVYGMVLDPNKFGQIFDEVHNRVERAYPKFGAGAVVSCVAIHESRLYLAQTGDCRLYVNAIDYQFGSGSICLSEDHIGENPSEAARIKSLAESNRFALMSGDDPRDTEMRLHYRDGDKWSYGSLQPTRAFGDHEFRPAITHKPEIRVFDLSRFEGKIFALCSDGGNAIVRSTFRSMAFWAKEGGFSVEYACEYAERIEPMMNDDDVTIIFFKVTKD